MSIMKAHGFAARPSGKDALPNLLAAATGVTLAWTAGVAAQQLTPDPSAWRPVSYADLQKPRPASATYADIWKDAIEANNRHYRDQGDLRFAEGNAPAIEAHFVIWSQTKSVVLSILNTAASCTQKEIRGPSRAIIKLCPMRIAIYEGIRVRTMNGGKACFLELTPGPAGAAADADLAASYVSYDTASKTMRIGLVIDHQAVEGCSQNIPLYPP